MESAMSRMSRSAHVFLLQPALQPAPTAAAYIWATITFEARMSSAASAAGIARVSVGSTSICGAYIATPQILARHASGSAHTQQRKTRCGNGVSFAPLGPRRARSSFYDAIGVVGRWRGRRWRRRRWRRRRGCGWGRRRRGRWRRWRGQGRWGGRRRGGRRWPGRWRNAIATAYIWAITAGFAIVGQAASVAGNARVSVVNARIGCAFKATAKILARHASGRGRTQQRKPSRENVVSSAERWVFIPRITRSIFYDAIGVVGRRRRRRWRRRWRCWRRCWRRGRCRGRRDDAAVGVEMHVERAPLFKCLASSVHPHDVYTGDGWNRRQCSGRVCIPGAGKKFAVQERHNRRVRFASSRRVVE